MPRPIKPGLDYFPLNVDISSSSKEMRIVESEYGILGFTVIIKLFMRIYELGYFIHWDESEQFLFKTNIIKGDNVCINKINVTLTTINDIINLGIIAGFFLHKPFKCYHILTSNGIQKRFAEATKRRIKVEVYDELWVAGDYVHINRVPLDINVYINSQAADINADISTQSKVKESILIKERAEETKSAVLRFYKSFHAKTKKIINPKEADYAQAAKLISRGFTVDTIEQAIDLYFSEKFWFNFDKAKDKFSWSFTGFCNNAEALVSFMADPVADKLTKPKEKTCPACENPFNASLFTCPICSLKWDKKDDPVEIRECREFLTARLPGNDSSEMDDGLINFEGDEL